MRGPEAETPVWQKLLNHEDCEVSVNARVDIQSGLVESRLIESLNALVQTHNVSISVIESGHPMRAATPSGLPNSHVFYRAADIVAVDGQRIGDNPVSPRLVDVGRILREIPRDRRPDRIMGPESWRRALGYPRSAGFLNTPFHNEIHADHVHIGFSQADATVNSE